MTVDDRPDNEKRSALTYDHVLFTDLDGVEGVLVDLNTKKYYQLNETASLIWRGLEQGKSVPEIAGELTERYDISLEHATLSVETSVRRFAVQKLIRQH